MAKDQTRRVIVEREGGDGQISTRSNSTVSWVIVKSTRAKYGRDFE
jgi:hypothetical protein